MRGQDASESTVSEQAADRRDDMHSSCLGRTHLCDPRLRRLAGWGTDHQYAYEKRDGIVYQSVPTGSFTGNFGVYPAGSGYTIWADSTQVSGHLKVTVDPAQTTVDYIKTGATSSAYTYSIVSVNPTVTISKPGNQATLDWPQVVAVDHYAV